MAVAFIDSNIGTTDSSGTITPSGSDRAILTAVCVDATADPGVTSVNFNTSEAHTDIAASHTTGTGQYAEAWHRVAPTATPASCDATGGIGDWRVASAAFSGVDQATPVADVEILESAGATSLSLSIDNCTADDMVWAALSINGVLTGITPDSGVTIQEQASGADTSAVFLTKPGAAGTVSIGASGWASARASIIGGRMKAAGGGGGGGPALFESAYSILEPQTNPLTISQW